MPLADWALGAVATPRDGVGLRQDAHPKYQEATASVAAALAKFEAEDLTPGLLDLFEGADRFTAKEMSRVMSIDFGEVLHPQLQREWVRKNVVLIKSLSFERLADMQDVLSGALPGQDRVEDLRARLMDRFSLAKPRADLIARDQTLKLNGQLAQARAVSVGVTSYTWVTSRDERVRGNPGGKYPNSHSDHWRLHGTVHRYDTPPVTNPRTGERNLPGQDYQCRCVAVPNTDELLGL